MDPWPCFPWEWKWLGLEPVLFAVVFKCQAAQAPSPVNQQLQGQGAATGGALYGWRRRPLAQMDPWPCFPWEWM